MKQRAGFVLVVLCLGSAVAYAAGVSSAIEDEYKQKLEGKGVVPKVDIKILKVTKSVHSDNTTGGGAVQNLQQVKDCTEITTQGVRYREEAHGQQTLYAPKGTPVMVQKVSFGKSEVEIKVKHPDQTDSTIVTFIMDKKMDEGFSDRAVFDKMLADTFETAP